MGPVGRVAIGSLLYADDIALLANQRADLERALAHLERWCHQWRLSFGRGVTKTAAITMGQRDGEPPPPFVLEGTAIPWVETYPYLGVTLDSRMTLEPFFTETRKRVLRSFFVIKQWARREEVPIPAVLEALRIYVKPKGLFCAELLIA